MPLAEEGGDGVADGDVAGNGSTVMGVRVEGEGRNAVSICQKQNSKSSPQLRVTLPAHFPEGWKGQKSVKKQRT